MESAITGEADTPMNAASQQLVADPLPFARSYQLEALEKAIKQNTVVFFETGTGKTLIAIMLLRSYAHLLRKPSSYVAVFLVPTVVLVTQQGKSVSMLTDLKVGHYYGELGVDLWNDSTWRKEIDGHEVLVMTPQILLNALRHRFIRLDQIKVLIFDECHNARGKHAYACIMMEFYHRELASNALQLPRILGMTASPIKAKASSSEEVYWKLISKHENLMNSKVFTCSSDLVIANYVPSSRHKVKKYNHMDIPLVTQKHLEENLKNLVQKHTLSLNRLETANTGVSSPSKRLRKLFSTFMYCLTELGVWLAMKAAEAYSRETDFLFRGMDASGERIVRAFSLDAFEVFSKSLPSGPQWSIHQDLEANLRAGYLTSKVICLIETLLEYRGINDLRCIIFVERIVTAIVIHHLLNELLQQLCGWRTEYTAGCTSKLQSQSRKEQNKIIDSFRNGAVNVIVATSMLEEGLDVQSCNLVVRFDLATNICSFIQSRGRARMRNSDFVLMMKSGDSSALARVENYLAGAEMMRKECVRHYDIPCEPIGTDMHSEPRFEVKSTGAIVTLSSSVSLLHFYCARLPSDMYFKPYPRFTKIDKDTESCTLHLPNSCAIQTVTERGPAKILKQLVCLEACKQLHKAGALTDNLVPDIVEEEVEARELGYEHYLDEHDTYFPPELIGSYDSNSGQIYQCYLLDLKSSRQYDVNLRDVVLAVHTRLPADLENFSFDFDFDLGKLTVGMKYVGQLPLKSEQVLLCWRFQTTIFRILLDRNLDKFNEEMDKLSKKNDGSSIFDYLLLPALQSNPIVSIDWKSVTAVSYPKNTVRDDHTRCFSSRGHGQYKRTNGGNLVCCCYLEQSLVCTPQNGFLYCITGPLDGINAGTHFQLEDGRHITYKKYYEERHGIKLQFENENFLNAKRIFSVQNCLQRCRISSKQESSNTTYELPPEVCSVLMSPISASTFYTFSFLPSVMHRIESLLMAANLKSMHMEPNVVIPILTVLEAITTKKCQESIHLESLETLGDSFLKYAASQHLFQAFQNRHEGLLSAKRERLTCNATLCKLGCDKKIVGFIRTEPFHKKSWIIPGTNCENHILGEETIFSKKFYIGKSRKIKLKTVADVVEALIGAYLRAGGERAALSFMTWLGIGINFVNVPYTRNFSVKPEMHVNVESLQSLLNYTFRDASLLVEALTHGSYMLPEIPGCYQRLEFLGDAVLDYLITRHLCHNYPGLSPGLLTDLRSASVNNECYALSAIKAGLYKHILHASQTLHGQIIQAVDKFEESPLASTFGWESESAFPKVLGDVIEALAGAIYVDSGYDKDRVFQSMRPLFEPLVTPETVRLQPKRELYELCQRHQYTFRKPVVSIQNGMVHATVQVEADDGVVHVHTCSERDKVTAKKLACKAVLKLLKGSKKRSRSDLKN